LSQRGKQKDILTTCGVPANNKSTLSAAQVKMFGSSHRVGDVHTNDKIVPSLHNRLTDTSEGRRILSRIILISCARNLLNQPWILPISTHRSSRIASLYSESELAKVKVSTKFASAIIGDNPFVMLALEQIQAAIADEKSPTKQILDQVYEPPAKRLMLQ
jgi:hypothetical protein